METKLRGKRIQPGLVRGRQSTELACISRQNGTAEEFPDTMYKLNKAGDAFRTGSEKLEQTGALLLGTLLLRQCFWARCGNERG